MMGALSQAASTASEIKYRSEMSQAAYTADRQRYLNDVNQNVYGAGSTGGAPQGQNGAPGIFNVDTPVRNERTLGGGDVTNRNNPPPVQSSFYQGTPSAPGIGTNPYGPTSPIPAQAPNRNAPSSPDDVVKWFNDQKTLGGLMPAHTPSAPRQAPIIEDGGSGMVGGRHMSEDAQYDFAENGPDRRFMHGGSVKALLDTIRNVESNNTDDAYGLLYGGETFDDFSAHPNRRIEFDDPTQSNGRNVTTAAGAYQFNEPTWREFAEKAGVSDFSPASQDRVAIELLDEIGALDALESGDFEEAVRLASSRWVGLGGSLAESSGQKSPAMGDSLAYFNKQMENLGDIPGPTREDGGFKFDPPASSSAATPQRTGPTLASIAGGENSTLASISGSQNIGSDYRIDPSGMSNRQLVDAASNQRTQISDDPRAQQGMFGSYDDARDTVQQRELNDYSVKNIRNMMEFADVAGELSMFDQAMDFGKIFDTEGQPLGDVKMGGMDAIKRNSRGNVENFKRGFDRIQQRLGEMDPTLRGMVTSSPYYMNQMVSGLGISDILLSSDQYLTQEDKQAILPYINHLTNLTSGAQSASNMPAGGVYAQIMMTMQQLQQSMAGQPTEQPQ